MDGVGLDLDSYAIRLLIPRKASNDLFPNSLNIIKLLLMHINYSLVYRTAVQEVEYCKVLLNNEIDVSGHTQRLDQFYDTLRYLIIR